MTYFDLIVDAGNGNIKAALVKGNSLLDIVTFPSLLRLTPDSFYVYGGFQLGDCSAVIGLDNEDREGVIDIGNVSNGKLKYLALMVASALSALDSHIPPGSTVKLHLMTLSFDKKDFIQTEIGKLNRLSIDLIPKNLAVRLESLLPEGVGCSLFAALEFKSAQSLSVLDIGSGTMNLASYNTVKNGYPRRTSFRFKGVGISSLERILCQQLEESSTNGRVDTRLVRHALQSNTYVLLDSYDGTPIGRQVDKAIETWMEQPQVKELLTKVIFTLQTGGYVSCCGGGFRLQKVRDAIETVVLSNCSEVSASNWLIPDNTDVLGVLGVANQIKKTNRKGNGN